VLPSFVQSRTISIPSNQSFPAADATANSAAVTFYTDAFPTNAKTTTVQYTVTGFTGTVNVNGSTRSDGDWYSIDTVDYVDESNTFGLTIEGFHPYIQLEFVSNCGTVTGVLVR
jgi:hypothetical protein